MRRAFLLLPLAAYVALPVTGCGKEEHNSPTDETPHDSGASGGAGAASENGGAPVIDGGAPATNSGAPASDGSAPESVGGTTGSDGGAPEGGQGGAPIGDGGAPSVPFKCNPVQAVATATFDELSSTFVGAVSDDGTTVVGTFSGDDTQAHAFRWRRESGIEDLRTSENKFGTALATNCDGTILIGEAVEDGGYAGALRWVEGAGHTPIACDPEYTAYLNAGVISADGSVTVGTCNKGFPGITERATRWLGSDPTPRPVSNIHSYGFDVSADGLVFLGQSLDPAWDGAFIWSENAPYIKSGPQYGFPSKISGDGKTVVGTQINAVFAFRWQAAGTLSIKCAGHNSCVAAAVNHDGSVIVLNTEETTPLIWTATKGIAPFKTAVVAAGVKLGSWTDLTVTDMTPDATVFVGIAKDGTDKQAGYRLQVPPGTF